MVLAAHSVDIAEWLITLWEPSRFSQHLVTHSPLWTSVLVVILWAILTLARVQSPWPYLCIAVAVFSHLLLDYLPARLLLLEVYGSTELTAWPDFRESIIAEIWIYGLVLVLVSLWQSARTTGCSRPARKLAGVMAASCVIAALTRNGYIWSVAYAIASAHALLLLRRAIKPALLWSLVPLIPMAAMGAVELWSLLIYRQARKLQAAGDFGEAAKRHREALAVPTRTSKVSILVYKSFCEVELKNWAAAEQDLLAAARVAEDPIWAELSLAEFYVNRRLRETPYFRPWEAQRIAERVAATATRPIDKAWAAEIVKRSQNATILR
ncbi:MAG TPA: hypothetical protein VJZ71_04525 [Phycisphaerae bacterium]|nr:hypothetical protein [Phycisphaerae bacterium]